jgi:hypothetical protein
VHDQRCAESRADPRDCKCSCRGRLHGSAWKTPAPPVPSVPPLPSSTPEFKVTPRRRSKHRRAATVAVAVTLTGTLGGLAATGTFNGSPNGGNLSVQVNADLGKTISALLALKFSGRSNSGTSLASYRTNCTESATGQVKQFLTRYPCKQYAAETWTITRRDVTTQVAFSWVEMPTVSLAGQYKAVVDKYDTGNPPGASSAFNGQCYASGQQGSTVWAVEVQPTGDVTADQEIVQAAAQANLPVDYLRQHCVI